MLTRTRIWTSRYVAFACACTKPMLSSAGTLPSSRKETKSPPAPLRCYLSHAHGQHSGVFLAGRSHSGNPASKIRQAGIHRPKKIACRLPQAGEEGGKQDSRHGPGVRAHGVVRAPPHTLGNHLRSRPITATTWSSTRMRNSGTATINRARSHCRSTSPAAPEHRAQGAPQRLDRRQLRGLRLKRRDETGSRSS